VNGAQDKLKEIVRDLREQKLLPVVAILVVLIIAVPMVLKAGGEEPAPPTELAVGLKPMLETQPVVLASAPELRDFRTRLDSFEKKNPFHQPEPVVAETDTTATDSTATDAAPTLGGTTTDTSSTDATATDFPPAPATDVPTTDPVGGDTPTGGDTGSDNGSDNGNPDPGPPQAEVISYDIDVEIGKAGDEKTMSGVEIGTLLPSTDHPLVQFVSTDLQGTSASFVVSTNVSSADGDGNCAPSRNDCQFLKLSVGDGERLFYTPNGETYRLKLTAITRRVDSLDKLSSAADDITDDVTAPLDGTIQWKTG
jgi:hypothetical protein